MATTSLWHIEGRLSDLIDYVENPEKTVPKGTEDFFNVFDYVRREDKTKDQYVTSINCLKEIALQQMIMTKKQYGKTDGYIAWHGYQSFKIGEVSPDTAHEIGVKLANEMWGDRFQIVVTTHLDKDHIHNHFAFNSVSFKDGGKYNYSKKELQRLRDTSDSLCREYELSVIENPHKAPSRPVWVAEKNGDPTRYNIYRESIREALANSNSIHDMEQYLIRLGYETDFTGKHWKIKLPQFKHYTRTDTLNPAWTPEGLQNGLGMSEFQKSTPMTLHYPHYKPYMMRRVYRPFGKPHNIRGLYIFYYHLLGFYKRDVYKRPISPFLKKDLRKAEEYSNQARYMGCFHIETMDDLLKHRKEIENLISILVNDRNHIQNKMRRASPEMKESLRADKAQITKAIQRCRKHLKINNEIEKRAYEIQGTLDRVVGNEAKVQGKSLDKYCRADERLASRVTPKQNREMDWER